MRGSTQSPADWYQLAGARGGAPPVWAFAKMSLGDLRLVLSAPGGGPDLK